MVSLFEFAWLCHYCHTEGTWIDSVGDIDGIDATSELQNTVWKLHVFSALLAFLR